MMNKIIKFALGALSLVIFPSAYAEELPADAAYQIFANIGYSNPAALNAVKKQDVILGGTVFVSWRQFQGTAQLRGAPPVRGIVDSKPWDFIPYGRYAIRINPKLVIGLDITQPAFVDIQYSTPSIIQSASSATIIRDVDISPRLSYQATERLALGVGVNFNRMYQAELSFIVPPNGEVSNIARGWAMGWNAGLVFALVPKKTQFMFTYYSRIIQNLTGTSTWGPIKTSTSVTIPIPAVYSAGINHVINPQWSVMGSIRYVEWSVLQTLVLPHTAIGTLKIPLLYRNGWGAQIGGKYQPNPKWQFLGALSFDNNVAPLHYRPLGQPTYSVLVPAAGASYSITKELSTKFVYAHGFSNPPINFLSVRSGNRFKGNVKTNVDIIDLSFTYSI